MIKRFLLRLIGKQPFEDALYYNPRIRKINLPDKDINRILEVKYDD